MCNCRVLESRISPGLCPSSTRLFFNHYNFFFFLYFIFIRISTLMDITFRDHLSIHYDSSKTSALKTCCSIFDDVIHLYQKIPPQKNWKPRPKIQRKIIFFPPNYQLKTRNRSISLSLSKNTQHSKIRNHLPYQPKGMEYKSCYMPQIISHKFNLWQNLIDSNRSNVIG